jgi:hypothetical protein
VQHYKAVGRPQPDSVMSLEAAPEAHCHGQSYVPNDKGKEKEGPRKRQRLMGRDSTARDAVFEELTELGYADALTSLQSTSCMDQQHDEIRPKYAQCRCFRVYRFC